MSDTQNPQPQPSAPQSAAQKKQTVIIVAVIVGVLLLAAAAKMLVRKAGQRAMDSYIESQTGVDISRGANGVTTYTDADGNTVSYDGDEQGGTVNFRGADGETGSYTTSSGANAAVPEGFPRDFPTYSGAALMSAYGGMEGDGHQGYSLMWQSDASHADVVAFYKSQLAASGWTVSGTFDMGGTTMIAYERGGSGADKDGGTVNIGTSDGKTIITVILALHAN